MSSQDHIKEAMTTLLKIFEEGNLEKVAQTVFKGGDIPAEWLTKFQQVKKAKDFRVHGFEILGSSSSLKSFCDQVTRLHELGITEAGDIFGGI